MRNFLLALQFLTIIPVKIKHTDEKKITQSMIYFPIVGLFLGFVLVGTNYLLYALRFMQFSTDIILIIFLIILTGGLHLDGLSDTFDAILSRKNKEEMLRIMQDSHVGVMGNLSVISILLLKVSFLHSISESLKPISLILMCVLSRWSLVFAMFLFPYARLEGKAKAFMKGINLKILVFATIITVIIIILAWHLKGLLILAMIAGSAYLICRAVNKKIGGITGDTLGAVNELAEVIALFSASILEKCAT